MFCGETDLTTKTHFVIHKAGFPALQAVQLMALLATGRARINVLNLCVTASERRLMVLPLHTNCSCVFCLSVVLKHVFRQSNFLIGTDGDGRRFFLLY